MGRGSPASGGNGYIRSMPRSKSPFWLAALVVHACGGQADGGQSAETPAPQVAFQEEWVEIDGVLFPAAMADAAPEVQEAYVFAAKHPEVLSYMPCYCGCENPRFAHRNNYDCFVDAIDTTGEKPRVAPDPMGFG